MLTCAYVTNRKDNRIEWFLDSLYKQWNADRIPLRIVVVDFFAEDQGRRDEVTTKSYKFSNDGISIIHTPPKPTVWQGPHRLTTRDYFAAANCRNTAICLAPDGWLAFVDDLSVLTPEWLSRVKAAMAGNYVALGTYSKVKELIVKDGNIVTFTHDPEGDDHRVVVARKKFSHLAVPPELYPAPGSWFFGCSVVAPVQAYLDVNGWDEDTDSMGYEDTPCGSMIAAAGYKILFDPAMKTLESWELHFVETPFLRIDKKNIKGQIDASNAYVRMLHSGRKRAPNYFGEGGIAAVRQRVLAGETFPITQCPDRDWRDGQLLSEM